MQADDSFFENWQTEAVPSNTITLENTYGEVPTLEGAATSSGKYLTAGGNLKLSQGQSLSAEFFFRGSVIDAGQYDSFFTLL